MSLKSSLPGCARGRNRSLNRTGHLDPTVARSARGGVDRYTSVDLRTTGLWRSQRGNSKRQVRIVNGLPGMRIARLLFMNFAFGLLVFTCGSLAAIAHQLRHAPEAFEDETGFHFSSSTDHRLPAGSGADLRAALFQAIGTAARRSREAH